MGLFDKVFGKKPLPAPQPEVDDRAPGWEAIDAALAKVYPGQKPLHLANGGVRWMHSLDGSANPLDGVHVFDAGSYWHYVGLGLSELYGKESDDPEVSGLGYEFTFRLRKTPTHQRPPVWPVDLMNGLGRPAMLGELELGENHTVSTGPFIPGGDPKTYVGVLFHHDPSLPAMPTPHGTLAFLLLVPVDAATFSRAKGGNAREVLAELGARDPEFVSADQGA